MALGLELFPSRPHRSHPLRQLPRVHSLRNVPVYLLTGHHPFYCFLLVGGELANVLLELCVLVFEKSRNEDVLLLDHGVGLVVLFGTGG